MKDTAVGAAVGVVAAPSKMGKTILQTLRGTQNKTEGERDAMLVNQQGINSGDDIVDQGAEEGNYAL